METKCKMPILKTDMERLLFAIARENVFDRAADQHRDRISRTRSQEMLNMHQNNFYRTVAKSNFWHKVVKYYTKKIENGDEIVKSVETFIVRYC